MRRLTLLFVAIGLVSATDALAQRRADPKVTYSIPVGDAPTRGSKDALVTLVAACEFGSPYCLRIRTTFDQLMGTYEGDLRIVYKHFVVYKQRSTNASLAACAAHQQGNFFEMEAILWTQAYQQDRDFSADKMRALARELGLDMKQFEADMEGTCKRVLASDQAQMERVGTTGVPASYVNGRFVSGARPFNSFKEIIDEELALARQRVKKGASKSSYYQEFVVKTGEKEAAEVAARAPRPPQKDDVPHRPRYGPDPAVVYAVPVGKSPSSGPADAKVTMVLGCQFSGPYCQRIQPILAQLREDYGKDLRIVYKHFVVHSGRATEPALAACAAHRQNKYFDMAAILWGEAYDKRTFDAEAMRAYAQELGLNMKRYDKDIKGACPDIVKAEQAELQNFGARGTPSSFINGRFLSGARPIEQFKALIDEELAKANAAIANRKQQKRYYEQHIVGKGKKAM